MGIYSVNYSYVYTDTSAQVASYRQDLLCFSLTISLDMRETLNQQNVFSQNNERLIFRSTELHVSFEIRLR